MAVKDITQVQFARHKQIFCHGRPGQSRTPLKAPHPPEIPPTHS